jgi:hypothetical protein
MKRECGTCSLCCKLMPVPQLNKPRDQRCQYQKHAKGCTVHGTAAQPPACKLWYCRWLVNDDAADLRRPDHAHYVIDAMPDEITVEPDDHSAPKQTLLAIQIWVDGDQWKNDVALRGWLFRKARDHGVPALMRYPDGHTVGVFAPPISTDGEWHIVGGTINPELGLWK